MHTRGAGNVAQYPPSAPECSPGFGYDVGPVAAAGRRANRSHRVTIRQTPHPPAGQSGSGPTIEFARSNLAVRWSGDYASLLELAEACDVPVRWSCRTGVCHSCETRLVCGTVRYGPDPVEPPADGSTLLCCAQPAGDLVLDL